MTQSHIAGPVLGIKTVLVVDDEVGLRVIMVEDVTSLGHRAVEADSVAQAKIAIEKGGIDVVVTDLKMPGEDGLALVQWITTARNGAPKAILVTGAVDRATRQRATDIGVTAILEKPYSFDELTAALAAILPG